MMDQLIKMIAQLTNKNRNVFFLFLGFSLVFFIQFPLQKSFVGDIDTIYNLALFQQMKNFIDMKLFGVQTGLLCAPTDLGFHQQAFINFGGNYGIGIFHVFMSYIGIPDLWAHWIFMAFLFAFNCYGLYLLLSLMFEDKWPAIAAAFFFNYAHFMLGNIDNINSVVFFLSYFSIYYYKQYVDALPTQQLSKFFYISVILGALTIYLSPYNFVIHIILFSVFVLFYEIRQVKWPNIIRFGLGFLLYLVIIFPYIYIYFISDWVSRGMNEFVTKDFIHVQSLNYDDLFRVLKGHLYMKSEIMLESPLLSKLRSCYLGIVIYVLALMGLLRKKNRAIGITFVLIGVIISVGPFLSYHNLRQGPTWIMYPIYEWLNLYDSISVPIRFFFISILGLSILAGNGLIFIYNKKKVILIPIVLSLLVLLENIPLKMEVFDHKFIMDIPDEIIDNLKQGDGDLIYHMPSSLYEINSNYRREYVYQYWQHLHKQNVVNCFPPFMPEGRKQIDVNLENFNRHQLAWVVRDNHIDKIVFSIDLVQSPEEGTQLDSLFNFSFLHLLVETDKTFIFGVDRSRL